MLGKRFFLIPGLLLMSVISAFAQQQPSATEKADYLQVITGRAAKIVGVLGIQDSVKFKRVRDIVTEQYRNLGLIHDERNAKVKQIKEAPEADKVKVNQQIAAIDSLVDIQLNNLHNRYLEKLSHEISADQVDQVKNSMTYNILPITYQAYLDELPQLTDAQKIQIKAWLTEAREHAIDAESSEKKHAWFGKFKGRINNYLSAQGYDMKKASEEWQKRIKAKAEQKG